MKYFGFKNWKTLQHYHDRRPPWVKWYNDCIEPGSFLYSIPDEMVGQYSKLLALASKMDNSIPYNPEIVAEEIHASSPVNLDAFAELGLFIIAEGREKLAIMEQKRQAKAKKKKSGPKADSTNASKDASKPDSGNAMPREQRTETDSKKENENMRGPIGPLSGLPDDVGDKPTPKIPIQNSQMRKAAIGLSKAFQNGQRNAWAFINEQPKEIQEYLIDQLHEISWEENTKALTPSQQKEVDTRLANMTKAADQGDWEEVTKIMEKAKTTKVMNEISFQWKNRNKIDGAIK